MQCGNRREAIREAMLDVEEGADIIMVKPAMSYLDIIRDLRERTEVPIAAYQVSGEYAMIKAAATNGWVNGTAIMKESIQSIKRAGADIVITYFAKEMADACRAEGLKFGFYTSQAGEWEYPMLQDDGSVKIAINTPANQQPYSPDMEWKCSGKVAVKDFVHDYIVPQSTEFIDKYDPDILWNDFDWMTPATENGSYEVAAYMYNKAEGRKEVACNDRHGKAEPKEIEGRFTKKKRSWLRTVRGDFFTDEWGDTEECLDPAKWHPWESCSGISKSYGNHWMESYDPSMVMTEKEFIIHFSDIVARGGNLLLLVNLDPQGAILPFQKERLEQIGRWLETYGEAIYGTRICAPYKTDKVDYTQSKDGKTAYAIVKEPSAEIELACALPAGTAVTVVGADRKLAARRTEKGTTVVSLPADLASAKIPFALRCTR